MASLKGTRAALWASVALTALLYVVPYGHIVGYPLVWLSTFAHELGHGITALLVGHDFLELRLYADGSGVAMHAGRSGRLAQALVAAGGLIGPAVAGAACFWGTTSIKRARGTLWAGAIIGGLVLVLYVRSLFGAVFVASLVALMVWMARRGGEAARILLAFLAIQLAMSVFSRGDYLFTQHAVTEAGTMPSDTEVMAQALLLPYWFWGLLVGALSVWILLQGVQRAVRSSG